MIPSLLPVVVPILVGLLLGPGWPGRPADGHHRHLPSSRYPAAAPGTTRRSTSRTATTAAKAARHYQGRQTGDTAGGPLQGHVLGPAVNPLIKIINIVALFIVPLVVKFHSGDVAAAPGRRLRPVPCRGARLGAAEAASVKVENGTCSPLLESGKACVLERRRKLADGEGRAERQQLVKRLLRRWLGDPAKNAELKGNGPRNVAAALKMAGVPEDKAELLAGGRCSVARLEARRVEAALRAAHRAPPTHHAHVRAARSLYCAVEAARSRRRSRTTSPTTPTCARIPGRAAGRTRLVAHEQAVLDRTAQVTSTCVRPSSSTATTWSSAGSRVHPSRRTLDAPGRARLAKRWGGRAHRAGGVPSTTLRK